MRVKILSLEISNFKGITKPTRIEFAGDKVTTIYGANHSGKTTTMDAMLWLLFGKNSAGETTFGIDPKDADGNVIHNLDNDVKGTFEIDGHHRVTLQRTRREIWKKSRGEETGTYSHSTDYHIDGELFTEKEYNAWRDENLISERLFKVLTNPQYFPSLKADDQRALLLKMVGEITNDQIAAASGKFDDILKELESTTLENYRRGLAYKVKEIKRELDVIPGRIAENRSPLADIEKQHLDFEQIYTNIEDTEFDISNIDAQLADANKAREAQVKAVEEARDKTIEIGQRARNGEREIEDYNRRLRNAHTTKVQELSDRERLLKVKITGVDNELDEYKRTLDRNEIRKVDIRKRWQEVEEMAFIWNGNENCPTCGQRLPEENIQNARIRAEKQFNDTKQREQDVLDDRIKEAKSIDADTAAQIENAKARKAKLEEELKAVTAERIDAEAEKVELRNWNDTEEAALLRRMLEEAEQTLQTKIAENTDTSLEAQSKLLLDKKKKLTARRDQLRDQMGLKAIAERHLNRIAELEKQETDLNQQLTDLERKEDEAKDFFMEGTRLLQNKVDGLFNVVEFRMFKQLMNGNIEPTCECTMHGTPYQDLSYSEKTNAALDIINAMCLYNDTYAPLWIDNAESITDITPTRSQQIRLQISTDRQLVVVTEE